MANTASNGVTDLRQAFELIKQNSPDTSKYIDFEAVNKKLDRLERDLFQLTHAAQDLTNALLRYDGQATDPANPRGWTEPDGFRAFTYANKALTDLKQG